MYYDGSMNLVTLILSAFHLTLFNPIEMNWTHCFKQDKKNYYAEKLCDDTKITSFK